MKIRRALALAGAILCAVWAADLAWLYQARATIASAQTSVTALGNGATTVFTFPFVGVKAADLVVTYTNAAGAQTVLTQGTQYTVSLNAPASGQVWGVGGTVTYPLSGSPIAAGSTLTIARTVPYTQTISSSQGQSFPLVVETALDLLAMQIQQVASVVNRAIGAPVTDTCGTIGKLPVAALRANQILGFDSTGCTPIAAQPSSALVSSAMQPVVAAATTGDALTALGLSTAANVPVGAEIDWPGLTAPSYWKLEDGSAISRTTYSALLGVVAPVVSCTITSGSSTITGLSSVAGWATGWVIESPGSSALGTGKTIASIGGSSVTISGGAATANATSCQIFPYGTAQDGTFNLPDARGTVYAMRDAAGTRLTTTYCGGNPSMLNAFCGAQSQTLITANLPPYTPAGTVSGTTNSGGVDHIHSYGSVSVVSAYGTGSANAYGAGGTSTTGLASAYLHTHTFSASLTGSAQGGTSTAFSILPPTRIRNKIIFAGVP